MSRRVASLLLAVSCVAAAITDAQALDWQLNGAKVILKRSLNGVEKLTLRSACCTNVPDAGSSDDPSLVGATVDILSATQGMATFTIPAGIGKPGWTVKTDLTLNWGPAFKFVNRDAPNGPSPVKVLMLRRTGPANAGLLKLVARGTGVPMMEPHGAVAIRVTTGGTRHCAVGDAAHVSTDVAGKYVAIAYMQLVMDCSDGALLIP